MDTPAEKKRLSDTVTFETSAGPLTVPVLDTIYALSDLAEDLEQEAKGKGETPTHRQYLDRVREYVSEKHSVEITCGEADSLRDELELAFARQKKFFRQALQATL